MTAGKTSEDTKLKVKGLSVFHMKHPGGSENRNKTTGKVEAKTADNSAL